MLTETQKNEKGPLSHRKMFVFGLRSNSEDRLSNPAKTLTETQKNEKGPLSHQKIKCLFLDYVQLLMIGQAIRAKNVD